MIRYLEIGKKLPLALFPIVIHLLAITVLIILGLLALLITSFVKDRSFVVKQVKLKDLSQIAIDILTFFGQQGEKEFTTNELSTLFKTAFNQTQFAIDELLKSDFLCTDTPFGEDPIYWLSTQGRALLGKEKLL
jgi:hypothetical protein